MFNDLFGDIKVRIARKDVELRKAYLVSIADDLALLAARMMQLDSALEVLSAKVNLGDCERCADIEEPTKSPIVYPEDLRDSACFAMLSPEYYFGKRSTDFYAKCNSAASLAKKWELSILSKQSVHQENDTTSNNDSPPER